MQGALLKTQPTSSLEMEGCRDAYLCSSVKGPAACKVVFDRAFEVTSNYHVSLHILLARHTACSGGNLRSTLALA